MPNSTNSNQALATSTVSTGQPFGYTTKQGAAVTQITNRATGVTINAMCGTITTDSTSLAAEASAKFIVTNSFVKVGDIVLLCQQSGAIALNTQVEVVLITAGAFTINVINNNVASGTAETGAILINFAIVRAVSA
jgi:hypothetical protein